MGKDKDKSKDKVKLEGVMTLAEAASTVADVASGLKAGSVCMAVGEDCLTLRPSAMVEVEMKLTRKKDRECVQIELNWPSGARIVSEPPAGEEVRS